MMPIAILQISKFRSLIFGVCECALRHCVRVCICVCARVSVSLCVDGNKYANIGIRSTSN